MLFIVKRWRSWGVQFKTKGAECCVPPFFCFTIMLGRTLLLRLKTSSPHLGGNKWTTPPYSSDLSLSDFHLFLHLKKFPGGKRFDDDDDLKEALQKWLTPQRPHSMRRVHKNLCPAKISASIMAANTWKNSLKNVESDNNKILYETLLDSFLQRNGTYFLNKPRMYRPFIY